ncbi:tRNA (adenosine(37)-N6)-threonylcarbamoyltransferase complex ATPase subunit type 1 TsaE [Candidatus Saccharibacteria bacterium]|nr:tRNA (adenosine(37)-N6)-threonylcarbamoyltransferase complex ATPase subunit type 1 TsaE [Candidatus Saccharibacteria bacterium]
MTWQMQSIDSASTEAFGERIGKYLKGGEVIELISDLGGGKTTLVRGIARGAGSTDTVSSPTFTVSKEYRADRFTIMHFDLYRLPEAGIIADELAEYIGDEQVVTIVEWADILQNVLPKERLTIRLTQTGEHTREVACIYPASLAYLLEELA